jgi:hypothetical protein
MQTLLSRSLPFGLTSTLLMAVGAGPVAASGPEGPIEEVRQSEPVRANHLLLRAVYQEPGQVDAAAAWTPVASARISGPVVLDCHAGRSVRNDSTQRRKQVDFVQL